MGAASFVLAINVFIAGLFTAAFGIIAWRNPTAIGARWLGLAYALGVFNSLLEFVLPWQDDPRPLSLLVFSVALAAFLVCVSALMSQRFSSSSATRKASSSDCIWFSRGSHRLS